MRKLLRVLCPCLLVFSYSFLTAQEWILQNPFSRLGTVSDLEIAVNGKGYAAGSDGLLLVTDNKGVIWEAREAPITTYYRTVEIMDDTDGEIALVGGQVLLRTADGGDTWTRITGVPSNVFGISSISSTVVFISTIQGGILKSVDAGVTFTEISTPILDVTDLYFEDEMRGWAIGRGGGDEIIRTVDGGETWTSYSETYSFLNKIHFASPSIGYATSGDGVLKTIDGGDTWNILAGSPDSNTDLHVLNEDVLWVTWGLVHQYSLDGGLTWSERDNPQLNGSTECVFLSHPDSIWVSGDNIVIGQSTDGGMTWSDQIPGNKSTLVSVDFLNDQVGYATGGSNDVLRTTNGGAIWESFGVEGEPIPTSIKIVDDNRVLLSGRDGIFLSEDQGETWSQLDPSENWVETFIYLDDTKIVLGLAIGDIQIIDITGQDVRTVYDYNSINSGINDIYFINSTKGWAVNNNGEILHSADGGESWNIQYTHPENIKLSSVFFINESIGYATLNFGGQFLKTIDGGVTWIIMDINRSTFWGGIHFINESVGWMVGGSATAGNIIRTEDGGETWQDDFSQNVAFFDISAPVDDEELAWAVGRGGLIARFALCNAAPILSSLNAPLTVCENDIITVEVDFEGIDVFTWSVPTGWNIVGNDVASQINIAVGSTSGDISVVGINSCEESSMPLTQSYDVPMANPIPTISEDMDGLTCQINGTSYQWYIDDEIILGATNSSFSPIESGLYFVRVMHANGCLSPPSNNIQIVISSTVNLDQRVIQIYPNPAHHQFYLKGLLSSDQVFVRSISGQLIRTYQGANASYDLNGLSSGLYLIEIKSGQKSGYLKLFLEAE